MDAPSMVQRAGDKFIVRSVVSGDQLFVDSSNRRKRGGGADQKSPMAGSAAAAESDDEDTVNELVINEDVLAEQDIDEEEEEVEEEDEPMLPEGAVQAQLQDDEWRQQLVKEKLFQLMNQNVMDTDSLSWLLFNNNNSVMQNKNVPGGSTGQGAGGGGGLGEEIPSKDGSDTNLPQCKIKRNYSCSNCTYFTQNPRQYLMHLRDTHGEKLIIHECKHCIYASRHYQKLVRHMKMVHGLSVDQDGSHLAVRKRGGPTLQQQQQQLQSQLLLSHFASSTAKRAKSSSASSSLGGADEINNNSVTEGGGGGQSAAGVGDAKGGPSCSSSRSSRNDLNLNLNLSNINTSCSRREDLFVVPPPHRPSRWVGGGKVDSLGEEGLEEREEKDFAKEEEKKGSHFENDFGHNGGDKNKNLISSLTCKPIQLLMCANSNSNNNNNHNNRGSNSAVSAKEGLGTENVPGTSFAASSTAVATSSNNSAKEYVSLLDLLNASKSSAASVNQRTAVNNCPGEVKEGGEREDVAMNVMMTLFYQQRLNMLQKIPPGPVNNNIDDNDDDEDEGGNEEAFDNPPPHKNTKLIITTPTTTTTTPTPDLVLVRNERSININATTNINNTTTAKEEAAEEEEEDDDVDNDDDDNDDDLDNHSHTDHHPQYNPTKSHRIMSKCAVCAFETQSRALLAEHEASEHIRTKFFRCAKCNYVTHIKTRFSKHVKYHSMPMIKCNLCDFRTPYKWNLDRHMKNHGGSGPFKCSTCNFTADIKQSLTVHEMNHHDPPVGHAAMAAGGSGVLSLQTQLGSGSSGRKRNRVGGSDVHNNELIAAAAAAGPTHQQLAEDGTSEFASGLSFHFLEGSSMLNDHLITAAAAVAAANLKKSARPIPNLIPIQTPPVPPPSTSALNLCNKSTDSNSEMSADQDQDQDENSNPTSVSSAFKKKHGSFFDKLKEKIGTNGDASDLTCACGHVAKCLSELFIHQKSCQKHKQHQMSSKTYSPNLVNKNSSRCQYCRHRCKSSADLVAHMQNCVNAQMFLSHALNVNIEQDSASEMDQSDDKMDGEETHPMENRIFVWNQMPESGGGDENNEGGSGSGSLSGNEGNNADLFLSTSNIKQEKMDDIDLDHVPFHQAPTTTTTTTNAHAQQQHGMLRNNKPGGNSGTCLKKVFKCPHCSFWASTASRFHVHIVGHLNKKPFECSLCAYRSNWRWDITKHIRLKTIRDPGHKTAKVLMNDETGRRNYTKYNKYITLMKVEGDGNLKLMKSGEMTPNQEASLQSPHDPNVTLSSVASSPSGGGGNSGGGAGSSLAKANLAAMQKLLLNDATSANLLKLSQGGFTAEDLLASGSELSALILGQQQVENAFNEGGGGSEKKQTSFKCRRCSFKHTNRSVVQEHVKVHYREESANVTMGPLSKALTSNNTKNNNNNNNNNNVPSVEITPIYNTTNNNIVGGLSAADANLLMANTKTLSNFLSSQSLLQTMSAVQAAAAVSGGSAGGGGGGVGGSSLANGIVMSSGGTVDGNGVLGGGGGVGGSGSVANQIQSLQMQPPLALAGKSQPPALMGLNASAMPPNACVKILPKPGQMGHSGGGVVGGSATAANSVATATGGRKLVNNPNQSNDHGEMDEASSGGTTVGHSYRSQLSYRCGHCQQVSNWKHVIQRHCRLKHGGNINIEQIGKNRGGAGAGAGAAAPKQTTDNSNSIQNSSTGELAQQLNANPINPIVIPKNNNNNNLTGQSPPLLAPLLRGGVSSNQTATELNRSKELQAVQQRFSSLINSIGSGVLAGESTPPPVEANRKKQYDCSYCSYVTDNKSQFSYHKSLHKPFAGEELQCNFCSYTATKRQLLTQHMRIHQSNPDDVIVVESENHSVFPKSAAEETQAGGNKPSENKENHVGAAAAAKRKKTEFMCPFCPYTDANSDLVNDHKQFHLAVSSERLKFNCEFCDFNAHSEKTMKDHRKLHFSFLEKGNAAVDFCTTYDKLKLFVTSTRAAGPSKDKKIYDEEEIEDENPWMHSATSSTAAVGSGSGGGAPGTGKGNGLKHSSRSGKMGTDSGAGKAAINV